MSNGQISIPFPYVSLPPTHIKALVQKIRSNINVSTHKRKFTKYENSFIGNELVSWLVKSKAVPSRKDAIQLCQRLFEARLIVHVKNNEMFKDDKELYHLIDPVAGSDLVPIQVEVQRARALIRHKGLPKNENGYKQLIKTLTTKGLQLPEISRAICLEKYKITDSEQFPKAKVNKVKKTYSNKSVLNKSIKTKNHNIHQTNHEHISYASPTQSMPTRSTMDMPSMNIGRSQTTQQSLQSQSSSTNGQHQHQQELPPFLTKNELIRISKKIIGILKFGFRAADQSQSNDLDLKEFEYLLDRLGIKVSHKGAELLFRAILSQHNKRFLGFYEFKMAFMVNDPLQHIETPNDLNPARILRRHIRQYYEKVAEEHKANRKKLAEIAWSLFNNDKTKNATLNVSQFREGTKYLGLSFLTNSETLFIFNKMNRSRTGMMKKEEFMHTVKKDIPVSIGKVVNVKDILYDTFERILKDFQGTKTQFPARQRNRSIVNRDDIKTSPLKQPQKRASMRINQHKHQNKNNKGKSLKDRTKSTGQVRNDKGDKEKQEKKSIFQRMRYKSKRKKTIKAPVKSPFGSNLAEMAESGSTMMDDIILSMINEDDDDTIIRAKSDSDIITADEFRQLFSHSFFPKTKEEKEAEKRKNQKPVNIQQFQITKQPQSNSRPSHVLTTSIPPPPMEPEPGSPHPGAPEMEPGASPISPGSVIPPQAPDAERKESNYSEIFPDIYPPNHDHAKDLATFNSQLSPTANSPNSHIDSMATNFSDNSVKKKRNLNQSLSTSQSTTNDRRWSNHRARNKSKNRKSRGRKGSKRNGYKKPLLSASPEAQEEELSEFEEEEKQSMRQRGNTEESVLDLQNSNHFHRAMKLKKATISSQEHEDDHHEDYHRDEDMTKTHYQSEEYVGTYSPPPPTLLSEAVAMAPWELDENDFDNLNQPNEWAPDKTHGDTMNHDDEVEEEDEEKEEVDPAFPPPSMQYRSQSQANDSIEIRRRHHEEEDEKVEVSVTVNINHGSGSYNLTGAHSKNPTTGSVVIKDDKEAFQSEISSQIQAIPQQSETDEDEDEDEDDDDEYDPEFPPPQYQYITVEEISRMNQDEDDGDDLIFNTNDNTSDESKDEEEGLGPIEVFQNEPYDIIPGGVLPKQATIEASQSHKTNRNIPKQPNFIDDIDQNENGNIIPYDEYNDEDLAVSGGHEAEHEMLEIRSQFTNVNSTKYIHPENDKLENKISTLILSDDILNESDDGLLDIEINDGNGNMNVVNHYYDPSSSRSQQHHIMMTPPRGIPAHSNSTTQTLTDSAKRNKSTSSLTPIPTELHNQNTSNASTPQSDLTRLSHVTPIGGYEAPIHTLQKFRLIHQEHTKIKHQQPSSQENISSLAYDEEDGLSFYDAGSILGKPKNGRDSRLTSDIGDINDNGLDELDELDELNEEQDSDYSDDSLRRLQQEYQRESQLKDELKDVLFNNGNIDDHDDPHPKDQIFPIGVVKENEETDNEAGFRSPKHGALAAKLYTNQFSESSVHPRDHDDNDQDDVPYHNSSVSESVNTMNNKRLSHLTQNTYRSAVREEDGYEIDVADSLFGDQKMDENHLIKLQANVHSDSTKLGRDYASEETADLGDSHEHSLIMHNQDSDNSLFNANIDIIAPIDTMKSLKPSVAKRLSASNTPTPNNGDDNINKKRLSASEGNHHRQDTPRNANPRNLKRKSKSKTKRKRHSKKKSKRDSILEDIAKDINFQKTAPQKPFDFDRLNRPRSIPYATPSQLQQIHAMVSAEKEEHDAINAGFELNSSSDEELIHLERIQESETIFSNNDNQHLKSQTPMADMIVDINNDEININTNTNTNVDDIISSELNGLGNIGNMNQMIRNPSDPENEPELTQIDDIDEDDNTFSMVMVPPLNAQQSKEQLEDAWAEARTLIKSPSMNDENNDDEDDDFPPIIDMISQNVPNPPQMSSRAIAELAKSLSSIHSAVIPQDIEDDADIFGTKVPNIENEVEWETHSRKASRRDNKFSDQDIDMDHYEEEKDDQYNQENDLTQLKKVDSLPRISATMKYVPTLQTGPGSNKDIPYLGTPIPANKKQSSLPISAQSLTLEMKDDNYDKTKNGKKRKKQYNKPQPPPPPTPPNTTKTKTSISWSTPENAKDPDIIAKKKKKKRKKDKYTSYMNLPPIPGVITLKRVVCTNLPRGKMKASETYYLRVYQGKCEAIETMRSQSRNNNNNKRRNGGGITFTSHESNPQNQPKPVVSTTTNSDHFVKRRSVAAKLKEIKSRKFPPSLPPSKKLGALPSLTVIKSYPVFAKQSEESVTWQNLPASITKDAKTLRVGIYMKRERELVLIGSAPLAKSKKNLIPKPRVGIKNTTLTLTLDVPDKFSIWKGNSSMEITYTFCPRQFNADIRVLQSTKLPMYSSSIPVTIQLIKSHLLKISQESDMIDDDTESDSDSDTESEHHDEHEYKIKTQNKNKNKNTFYNQKQPSRNLINNLVGDMNSGHYKLDKVENAVVWHGLLRWFREMGPNPLLHSNNLETEFINKHNEIDDNQFRIKLLTKLSDPYLSIFLWLIDFLIEISVWYHEKLNIDNQMIESLVPNIFGFDVTQKHKLPTNAYSFIIRIIDLRQKQQFKIN